MLPPTRIDKAKWCVSNSDDAFACRWSLFEHLDQGVTVDEFLDWFPEVAAEQVHEVAFALERPVAVA